NADGATAGGRGVGPEDLQRGRRTHPRVAANARIRGDRRKVEPGGISDRQGPAVQLVFGSITARVLLAAVASGISLGTCGDYIRPLTSKSRFSHSGQNRYRFSGFPWWPKGCSIEPAL